VDDFRKCVTPGGRDTTLSKQRTQDLRTDYWSIRPTDAYAVLGTTEQGLSEQEAQYRIRKYGYNELPEKGFRWVQVLLRQFKNPVSGILFASAIVGPAFPFIMKEFAIPLGMLGFLASAWNVGYLFTPVGGIISDRYGEPGSRIHPSDAC
jgi:magnesium-transporting ATPase (P-type)